VSAEELVRTIEQSGGAIAIAERGDRLRYRIPANASSLLEELRRMKREVILLLRRRSFLHLVPFVGKRVWTPEGPGMLERLDDYATVGYSHAKKLLWYDATAVIPYA
jgi:hypothetical protein